MPPSQRLVLDFGLGDFKGTGLIECWLANEVAAGYCGKYLFVFDRQTCPAHLHRKKHETFFIAKGRVRMVIDSTLPGKWAAATSWSCRPAGSTVSRALARPSCWN